MGSGYTPKWKRLLIKTFPFIVKKCDEGNYHWRFDRLCFCQYNENGNKIMDMKTRRQYDFYDGFHPYESKPENKIYSAPKADTLPTKEESVSQEMLCLCGKRKGWITEGKTTDPCPNCGRIYLGEYDEKNLCIKATEIELNTPPTGVEKKGTTIYQGNCPYCGEAFDAIVKYNFHLIDFHKIVPPEKLASCLPKNFKIAPPTDVI